MFWEVGDRFSRKYVSRYIYLQLKILPTCLACCCPRLARLNISHNELTSLGPVECLPSRLRHLDVSHNQLIMAFEEATSVQLTCHATATIGSNGVAQLRQSSPSRNPSK